MLGFLKRKKKDQDDAPEKKAPPKKENGDFPSEAEKVAPKKKRLPIKLIIIILVVLIAVGVSGFVVYKFWFSAPPEGKTEERVYKQIELTHVTLPEEMVRFSFDHFPPLYDAIVTYNAEMMLLEKEIDRIVKIGELYPEQKKIADKEKKAWEKTKETLKKSFIKIEKPVKETYVLFRVNEAQGRVRITEMQQELADAALSALAPAQEMTQKLKNAEQAPEGLIKGTIYKLKKKFL
jgi:hypothetical protein